MTDSDRDSITRLLVGLRGHEPGAAESLFPLVYDELHRRAQMVFAKEGPGHTLQPTALIHEVWLRLGGPLAGGTQAVSDREHFFRLAARVMRQVLGDHARRRRSQKRGGGACKVTIDHAAQPGTSGSIGLIDLDDSLTRLSTLKPRHAKVVELRVLGGLTIAEVAKALEVSTTTVESDWFMAKAWLRTELGLAL